ncbi:hypothetical protein SLOPH_936, partial [Spraguea lophii 42_110]
KIKADKMLLLNYKIFIKTNNHFLEYISEYIVGLKEECIENYESRHKGINSTFIEIKNKFYNIKITNIKAVLDNCFISGTHGTYIDQISPIIIIQKFDRIQLDIAYLLDY